MTTQNLKSVLALISEVKAPENMTWSYTLGNSKNGKQVLYVNLLDATGGIVRKSPKISNVSNYNELHEIMELMLLGISNDASFATAKVEEYNERGHEEQAMTYCKHVDWVSEVSNIYDKQASKKDPHLYNVTVEDVQSLDINRWINDSIGDYIYTDEMIKEYNMVYDYMVKLPCGDYITKHTWDCYAKAINKYKNLLAGNKKGYKKHSKIELRLKDTCMA